MTSPRSTLPQDDEERNRLNNPGETRSRELFDAEKATPDVAAGVDPKNDGDAVKEGEEDPKVPGKEGLYRRSSGGKVATPTLLGYLKKRGPLGAIAAIFLGGGGLLGFIFAPGLGIVQLKEVLMGDLNDQLAAFDLRSDRMLRTKIGGLQSGVCSNAVKIRCQFTTMSQRQVDKFRKAGFVIDEQRSGPFGRQRIVSMTAPTGDKINNPQDLTNLRKNPTVRSSLNRVFNPLYASLSDYVANKTFDTKFKTSKASKLTGTTPDELDESMRNNTTGERPSGQRPVLVDGDDRFILDDEGNRVAEGTDRFNQIVADDDAKTGVLNNRANQVADTNVKAVGGVLGGALKGASLIGIADSACSVYNVSRAVAAAAKAARAIQLAQYSMVFLTTADKIKAGVATPEEVEYLGNIVAAVDTREKITDELSPLSEAVTVAEAQDLADSGEIQRDNPFYGKNFFDSPGYKTAAYNEAPTLTTQSQQYMIGGGLSGTFSSVTDDIVSAVSPGNPSGVRDACGAIQSWWVRGAGLALGVAAAIGSFGVTTILSVGGSIGFAMALPFLEAALTDIVAGKVVGPNTVGVEAGDATFAGTAALLGGVAQARGLKPLSADEVASYATLTDQVEGEYIAQARYEAKDTPLDVMNQYSFLGSFARSLNIPYIKAASSIGGTLQAIPQILSTSVASIIPSVGAQQGFNPERFTKCQDEGYAELNIAADVFCNVRYGLTTADLDRDPLDVVDFMLDGDFDGGFINPSGTPVSGSLYDTYVKKCIDRENGWGESGQEQADDWDIGLACVGQSSVVSETQLSNFRVYTIDKSISDAMEDEEPSVSSQIGDIVSPVSAGASISSNFGPRTSPCAGCSSWHRGTDFTSADRAVFAIMDGEVTQVGGSSNNTVYVRHADGSVSTYWHMYLADIKVEVGDVVAAGDQLGLMGNAGQSTGTHLHIEIDISEADDPEELARLYEVNTGGGGPGTRVNPADFLAKNGVDGF